MDDGHDLGKPRSAEPLSVSLLVPAALALVAGFVDAVGYLHLFGVFPANQSGNAILLGVSLSESGPAPAWAAGGALAAFVAGVAGMGWLSRRFGSTHRAVVMLSIECALLVALAAGVLAAGVPEAVASTGGEDPSLLPANWRFALVVLASLAMGVQTEVIRRVAGVAVATTYQSGAVARVGETLATLPGTHERRDVTRVLVVLGVVFTAYVLGAGLGASELGVGTAGLVVPCAAVAVLIGVVGARPGLVRSDS